jgi:hypothetical protein
MAEQKVEVNAAGCLGRVFTLLGIFLFGSALFRQVLNFSGDGVGFELSGVLIPGLVLLAMGSSLRRRANASKPNQGQVQIPIKTPPRRSPAKQAPATAPKTQPKAAPPVAKIPELPPVEEIHGPGELPAVEDLTLEDFESVDKPMSSEERLRIAKEKYRKRS